MDREIIPQQRRSKLRLRVPFVNEFAHQTIFFDQFFF